MANITISTNKIRQILRLYDQGMGKQTMADYVGVLRTTVKKYIAAFDACGFPVKEVDALNDTELNELFGEVTMKVRSVKPKMEALTRCFPLMEKELKCTGATRQLLSTRIISGNFRLWQQRVNPTMHRTHKVGDKLFVDFSGKKMSLLRLHHLFVLGRDFPLLIC